MVCAELKSTGWCSAGENCHYSHFLKFCHLCNAQLVSQYAFQQHYSGKPHSQRVYHAGDGHGGICGCCGGTYGPPHTLASFFIHCKSPGHFKLAAQRQEEDNVRRDLKNIPEGSVLCTTCNIPIAEPWFNSHLRSRRHFAAIGFHNTKANFSEVSKNRHSVEVSGDEEAGFNFGIVDPSERLATLPIEVKLMGTGDVSLVDIRLSSMTGSRKFAQDQHFTLPQWRGKLVPRDTHLLILMFHPHDLLGRFEDRIELVFQDASLNQRFTIARRLRAEVGNKHELASLAPIAPYVRPKPKRPQVHVDIVDGIKVPFISEIQWAVHLPQFKVPASISKTLGSGRPEAQTSAIKETLLPALLNAQTYPRHWATLLHVEEVQMIIDLSQYDMERETLTASGPFYTLTVPGLAEKRPSVILGDQIRVRHHGGKDHWWGGYVHKVELNQVLLRFHNNFKAFKGQLFDVCFSLSRTPLRRMHQALSVAWNPERILFPTGEHILQGYYPTQDEIDGTRLFNKYLEDNPPQKLAVTSILSRPAGSVPFVIFGPPGTGKTVVSVEAMRQILARNHKSRILACAPSNSAADLLADRLRQQGIAPSEMFRLNAATRLVSTLPNTLKTYARISENAFVIPPVEDLKKFRVVVATCISASLPYALGIERGHFSHIFIDEAGQALEPEAMIAIRTMAGVNTNVVLSGDPQQLGPIVRSRIATKLGLATSYLDRLMSRDIYNLDTGKGITIVKLIQNFRSHSAILSYPNDMFYQGDLQVRADPMVINSLSRWGRLVTPNFPIIFHAITGEDKREASSPSFFNPHEVLVVKSYVQELREDQRLRLDDTQIGVISPYNAQNAKIRAAINTAALKKSRPGILKVGSVEEFQGQERRVIIISTVRSNTNFVEFDINHTLGFVANPRRFNVAITRAQALLIIVGDPVVLSLDPMWREFLEYIHSSGGWRGKPKDWGSGDWAADGSRDIVRERRADARDAMDELTRRMQDIVIGNLDGQDDGSSDGEEAAQDKPWREDE